MRSDQTKRRLRAHVPGRGSCSIAIGHGQLLAISEDDGRPGDPLCSPGFCDLQINGFAGVDFADDRIDPQSIQKLLQAVWSTGCTTFLPTLITNRLSAMEDSLRGLQRLREAVPAFARSVPGYHLEGPFLSAGPAHGAHDPDLMRDPSWDEFSRLQDAAGGRIRLVTIAPERSGAIDFIRRATSAGVTVAVGHSDGTPEDIRAAAAAGATLSTHLGNGCPQLIDRHRAPFWAQLAEDRMAAGIICDGFHLPEEIVLAISRVKGCQRTVLVSDAVHVAGLPPGFYSLVETPIELLHSGKVVRTDGGSMAGSTLRLDDAVNNLVRMAGVPLESAVSCAGAIPARFVAGDQVCRAIAPGQPANLVLWTNESGRLVVRETIVAGLTVWSAA